MQFAILEFAQLNFLIGAHHFSVSIQQIVEEEAFLFFATLQYLRSFSTKLTFSEHAFQDFISSDGKAIAVGFVTVLIKFTNIEFFRFLELDPNAAKSNEIICLLSMLNLKNLLTRPYFKLVLEF